MSVIGWGLDRFGLRRAADPVTEASDPVANEPASSRPPSERETPTLAASDPLVIMQAGQFILLLIAGLWLAREIVLPIVLALLLKLLLQPGVRLLERWRLPRSLASVAMVFGFLGLLVSLGTAVSGPARDWAQKLPAGIPRVEERLTFISTPLGTLRRFLEDAERYTQLNPQQTITVIPSASPRLSEVLFSGTASFARGLATTVVILYFLLLSGDVFLRRLVEVLPRFRDKRTAVTISHQIEGEIAGYLLTITVMNAMVGVATGAAMVACGLSNPLFWGVLAFLFNFIPILGPILCGALLALAGLLTLDPLWRAFVPVATFLLIHLCEAQFVTPLLVARRFTLNPVAIMISLIFWYWLWGVPGAMVAVPMLAALKIVCDGIRPWAALGHLIGG